MESKFHIAQENVGTITLFIFLLIVNEFNLYDRICVFFYTLLRL